MNESTMDHEVSETTKFGNVQATSAGNKVFEEEHRSDIRMRQSRKNK